MPKQVNCRHPYLRKLFPAKNNPPQKFLGECITKTESLWSHCAIFWCDGRSRENSCLKQLAFATAHLQALDFVVRRGKEGRVGGTNKQKKERRRKGFGAKSLIQSAHT